MAWSPSWAKHAAGCGPAPLCTFLPSLGCASFVSRPAGRQLRKLNWLKCNLPKMYFLLALLHEAAHHGDQWEPELTCGREQQESPSLYLRLMLWCSLGTAGVWPPEKWLHVFLSSPAVLLCALPVCTSTLPLHDPCLVLAVTSPFCSPDTLAVLHRFLQSAAQTGGERRRDGKVKWALSLWSSVRGMLV